MTGEILKDIVSTLDQHNLFDREDRKKPFLLVDGHGLWLSEPFVQYITNIAHKWCCCFGVPYGTKLWQVGDIPQQNRSYKISVSKNKDIIVEGRLTKQ